MIQHQWDDWEVLVISAFCSDANVSFNPTADNFVATVSWPLPTEDRPNRRSKTIRLLITREALRLYLEKDESRREQDEQKVKEWIRKQLQQFDADHDAHRNQPPPQGDWVISTEVLNS